MSNRKTASYPPRKRGNPNWGKPILQPLPNNKTEFEILVKKLGLRKADYVRSAELKNWCNRNKNRVYIPEWLLQEFGIEVEAISSGPGKAGS